MRVLLAMLFACLLAGAAAADPAQPPPRTRLLGFADAQGRMVVEPIYTAISFFNPGDWAAISLGGKSGFVNLRTGAGTGLIFDGVSTDLFSAIPLFANGPEPVIQSGKSGYSDESGRIVLPAIYDLAKRFSADGLAIVTLDGRQGCIDRNGRFTPLGEYDEIRDFSEGLARVRKGQKFGAIDRQGKLVVPTRFGFLGDFTPIGLAVASEDGWLMREGAHYGFVDKSGRFAIAPVYAAASGFIEPGEELGRQAPPGLARVATYEADGSHRTGYIDSAGHMVTLLPPEINGWHVSTNGLIQVQNGKTAKWGFADASGRLVIPPMFESASGFGPNGLAPARIGGKYGYIRTDGSFAIEPAYDSAGMFDSRGRAQVWQGRQSRLIDSSGKVTVTFPPIGRTLSLSPSGFAPVEYFPPQYDYPVRRFGRWTLERTLYAVPEIPSMMPATTARVRLSMRSDDGLIAWTAESEGWVLEIRTETYPEGPDRVDSNAIDVLPFGAIGLLDYFRRQMKGEFKTAISSSSANLAAQREQAARLRAVAARRGDYLGQLEESRPDLERAWAAMREDIAEQFGKLSGPPCPVSECVY